MAEFDALAFAGATPITVRIGESGVVLKPKKFSTGSSGWHGNGKLWVQGFQVQANVLLTVVFSKPGSGPKAPAPPPAESAEYREELRKLHEDEQARPQEPATPEDLYQVPEPRADARKTRKKKT